MTKTEFLARLRTALRGLPQADVEERLAFYSEMIDDRVEDGIAEEEAVAAIGTAEEIAAHIVSEMPFAKLVKEKMRPKKRLDAWAVVLLVLGAPIWGSLLIAAFAVAFSLYLSVWAIIVSLWAVFASLVGCAVGGVVGGIGFAVGGFLPTGLAAVGAAFVCAGLCVFAFFGCRAATRGIVLLTKKVVFAMKNSLLKKEGAQ